MNYKEHNDKVKQEWEANGKKQRVMWKDADGTLQDTDNYPYWHNSTEYHIHPDDVITKDSSIINSSFDKTSSSSSSSSSKYAYAKSIIEAAERGEVIESTSIGSSEFIRDDLWTADILEIINNPLRVRVAPKLITKEVTLWGYEQCSTGNRIWYEIDMDTITNTGDFRFVGKVTTTIEVIKPS